MYFHRQTHWHTQIYTCAAVCTQSECCTTLDSPRRTSSWSKKNEHSVGFLFPFNNTCSAIAWGLKTLLSQHPFNYMHLYTSAVLILPSMEWCREHVEGAFLTSPVIALPGLDPHHKIGRDLTLTSPPEIPLSSTFLPSVPAGTSLKEPLQQEVSVLSVPMVSDSLILKLPSSPHLFA